MTPQRLFSAIALLGAAGVVVSSVSLYQHYSTGQSSYCDFGQAFNCDIVNRSIYSEVMGVPVALIGILGYLALLYLATLRRGRAETPVILLAASLAGLTFALYLTYVEKFVLTVWCVLCLSSLGVITAIATFSFLLVLQAGRDA